MIRVKSLIFVIMVTIFCQSVVFSEDAAEEKKAAEEKNEKQAQRERMAGMVMSMLGNMQKQIVATPDGGVVVLMGNKLLKYDKDLNLKRAVELTTEPEPNEKQ